VAARFILEHQGVARLSLVSHSWGSMPTGRFAGMHPASLCQISSKKFGQIIRKVTDCDLENYCVILTAAA
jgi:hypothetical protein